MAAPPSVGTSLPSINGQSVNTSCASLALTYVPTRRRSPTTVAVTRANREKDRSVPSVAPPSMTSVVLAARTEAATYVTSAIRSRATTKCAVTHQASRSVATTTAPSPAWAITSGNARTAGQSTDGSRRSERIAARPVSAESTATRNAIPRCENSMSEWTVPEGKRRPGSQPGQVEHPRPEPVPRTSPPIANSTTVAIAVASARVRKRERETGMATHA